MNPQSPATEAVVRHHLTAFLERRGLDAIVADYSEAAHFHTEAEVYVGKQAIHGFFEHFIEAKRREWFEYLQQVSAWEIGRYLKVY